MSRATKHTVNETIEQLFEDEDEIPDHASDSEIEGDSDEEYNDILHFQGPVLFQAAVAAGTDTSLPNVSSTSTIATRQSKKQPSENLPTRLFIVLRGLVVRQLLLLTI